MSQNPSKIYFGVLTIVMLAFNHACVPLRKQTTEPPLLQKTNTVVLQTPTQLVPTPTIPKSFATNTLAPSSVNIVRPSPHSAVTVTAANGNLFIRRGPHMAYNPVSVLYEGESVTALGRDVLAKWIQIPIPSQPGQTGWLSIQTRYSAVSGDVMNLPVVDTVDWPVAAYLRNCTYHQMLVKPGDILLLSANDFPANEKWIYPGLYTVHDLEVPGEPEVMSVELREGSEIEIRKDGNGEGRKCP